MAKQEMIYNPGGDAGKSSISAVELYRFIEWVASAILGILLTVWAFVPEEFLHEKLQAIQFPDRYYILAVGNWLGVTLVYQAVLVHGVTMMAAHPRDSYFTMIDKHTRLYPAPKRAQDDQ